MQYKKHYKRGVTFKDDTLILFSLQSLKKSLGDSEGKLVKVYRKEVKDRMLVSFKILEPDAPYYIGLSYEASGYTELKKKVYITKYSSFTEILKEIGEL